MKRSSPLENSPCKRHKSLHISVFEDCDQERDAMDVLNGGTDGTGYLSGQVFMTWKPTNKKLRIVFRTVRSPQYQFEVEFTDVCSAFFDKLVFKTQDEILLALKGANVEKTHPTTTRENVLHMKLQYSQGVMVKFMRRRSLDLGPSTDVIDTWELKEVMEAQEAEAPHTPVLGVLGEGGIQGTMVNVPQQESSAYLHAATSSGRENEATPDVMARMDTLDSSSRHQLLSTDFGMAPIQLDPPPQQLPDIVHNQVHRRMTRKQLRKAKKTHRASSRISPALPIDVAPRATSEVTGDITPGLPLPAAILTPTPSTTHPLQPTHETPTNIISTTHQHQQLPSSNHPYLKAGINTPTAIYAPLNDIQSDRYINVIGVVTSMTAATTTKTGELSCRISIIDPSIIMVDHISGPEGFKINCFTKKYSQWLPQPKLGDVLILRDLKTSKPPWNNGVGYHGRLNWAIYLPETGKISHGDLGNAPQSEGLADDFGFEFTPFFQPGDSEQKYCLKISDWWSEVKKYRKGIESEILQMRGDSHFLQPQRVGRAHRLISEVHPDIPPQGYFDCTVEILHSFMNDDGRVCSVYVTDYTANSSTIPCQAKWCPPGLSNFVLKMEFWDNAIPIGQTMQPGEYYTLRNARARISLGGFLEGKLVEPKAFKLKESDEDHSVFLKDLQERKKRWQKETSTDAPNYFEFRLIEQAEEGKFFRCVVEVLHAVHDTSGVPCIYVTDYTFRNELVVPAIKESWASGLEGRVVKIALYDGQVQMAQLVEPGSYYTIDNLPLQKSKSTNMFQGRLGGPDRLINKINVKKANDELQALIQRKDRWKETLTKTERHKTTSLHIGNAPRSGKQDRYTTIERVKASEKCPNKFRVKARIIDFYPLDLVDCLILHCANCKSDIPNSQRACFACDDSDHEYVRYLYQMFLLLEDESGSQLRVSANDNCFIFKGLPRADIRYDKGGFQALVQRMEPILGNLITAHKNLQNKLVVPPDTLLQTLIINSWNAGSETAYCVAERGDNDP